MEESGHEGSGEGGACKKTNSEESARLSLMEVANTRYLNKQGSWGGVIAQTVTRSVGTNRGKVEPMREGS